MRGPSTQSSRFGPRAIVFDLDGTLICATRPRAGLLRELVAERAEIFEQLSTDDAVDELSRGFEDFWANGGRNERMRARSQAEARKEVIERAFARLQDRGARLAGQEAAKGFAEAYHTKRGQELECVPQARETLSELQRRGVSLALLTNGTAVAQREKIDRFELGSYFTLTLIEGELGFGKPDLRAYQAALDGLGVSSKEAWMVGDRLELDVFPAQRLGMRGIWCDLFGKGLSADGSGRPDRIIRSLDELLVEG